jgi:hypothetical protein
MTASGGSRALRLCERTASTLAVRHARALPLAAAAEESRGLRSAIADLKTEATRPGPGSPGHPRRATSALPRRSSRTATNAPRPGSAKLAGAEAIAIAARDVADAYSKLATSAKSGSAERWNEASDEVRRSDALLAETIATAG